MSVGRVEGKPQVLGALMRSGIGKGTLAFSSHVLIMLPAQA